MNTDLYIRYETRKGMTIDAEETFVLTAEIGRIDFVRGDLRLEFGYTASLRVEGTKVDIQVSGSASHGTELARSRAEGLIAAAQLADNFIEFTAREKMMPLAGWFKVSVGSMGIIEWNSEEQKNVIVKEATS